MRKKMETKQNRLDDLKGHNPFKVPEGYFENLNNQIMSQLPELPHQAPKTVSLYSRVRPWLYMAAVFAGLLITFKLITYLQPSEKDTSQGTPLYVHATISGETVLTASEEEQDYFEYLETTYINNTIAEVVDNTLF
ncbi:MAG: hypothetical protein LBN71_08610 [Tannerella sp.]|nr:hypothetical protein [Tannerella sp.]